MAGPKRFKGISVHAARLLGEGESERGDFKRVPDGISADDLVAFANTESGGTILAGIDERAGPKGVQIGFVLGCDVSDAAILQVVNKALSCLPPVAINVCIENLGEKPFLRIDVPPSLTKPHCTPKGIYCRRDGSRNRPLHPSELLKIFLESEARAFAERFEAAANRITEDLDELESNLESSIKSMADQFGWAEYKLSDTGSTLDSIFAYVQRLDAQSADLTGRLRAMFRQDKRRDPIVERERKRLVDGIVKQLSADENFLEKLKPGASLSINMGEKAREELVQEDVEDALADAVRIAREKVADRKYSIHIKRPSECAAGEIEKLAALVMEGGEVADGVEQRLKSAHRIGLVRYEEQPVGTAALKMPSAHYRKGVFEKAKSSVSPEDFPHELGWVFMREEHTSKGRIKILIDDLLKTSDACGVFATTRNNNAKMKRILARHNFVPHGDGYPSIQNPGEEIVLFIRLGSTVS